jgi:MFS family permease
MAAYTLALAGLLLLGGRLADRYGARNTLLIGVIGFACASAAGGAAVDGAMLITARAVQGAFGAMLVSSTKSLLVNVYTDGAERARAIGIFTATLTAGLALGLVLGGVLTSALNWRWCLYVNVPLSLIAIVGAPRVLPALPGRPQITIDVASAALACAGMVALIYGLGEASSLRWGSGQVAGPLIAAAVLLGGFMARQVGRPDSGAAGAATSAAGQLGSSVGAALLNTIAAIATSSYLAAGASTDAVTAVVHGFAVAMAWGAGLLILAAIPVAIFMPTRRPAT